VSGTASLLLQPFNTLPSPQVNGVEKIHPIGPLSPEEQKLLDACLPELKKNIDKGKAFAA
jgi:malate/lactate dehydrogenase